MEKFDPARLMDGVKDRIKATFVSLIPDDAWEKMVEKELYVFTEGKIEVHHDYIGRGENGENKYADWEERIPYSQKGDDISPLQKMIRSMLEERFKKDLADYLASPEYQHLWSGYGKPEASKAVEEILVKNADDILHNILAGMMQAGFDRMRSNISDMIAQGYRQY